MERFRGRARTAAGPKGVNPPLNRTLTAEDGSLLTVPVFFKRGNKESTQLPCIVIQFVGEEMREEEFMRGAELEDIVGRQESTGGVDTVWSAPHPDPCDVTYEFLLYGRNSDECEILATDVKRLFPQKWYLTVHYGDGSKPNLDMRRVEGPSVLKEGELTLDSFTLMDAGAEVWSLKYMVEGYDENLHARRYETTVTDFEIVYAVSGSLETEEDE